MNATTLRQEYAPSRAYSFALQPDRCHAGKAPTIRESVSIYGVPEVLGLVTDYVLDLMDYCMIQRRPPAKVLQEIGMCVISCYSRLKVTQLILFFVLCKAGQMGKFYQSLEPMDIMAKLAEYAPRAYAQRDEILSRLYDEFQDCQRDGKIARDRDFSDAVSYYTTDGQVCFTFNDSQDNGKS